MTVPGHQRTHQILASAEDELAAAFRRAEASFQHMGDRGDARESAVRSFLTDQLPARFVVSAGEVMDAAGNVSGQTNVVIYDGLNTRPLFTTNGVALLPAEALLATVEVKSKLDKSETDKAAGGMVIPGVLRPSGGGRAAAAAGACCRGCSQQSLGSRLILLNQHGRRTRYLGYEHRVLPQDSRQHISTGWLSSTVEVCFHRQAGPTSQILEEAFSACGSFSWLAS